MRPGQQQNKQRMRGRGRKGPNPLSRSYESNGPDVKIRGTAQHVAEKYLTLARDASASGDRVMAENYLQHAEHYGRIVAAAQGSFQAQRDEREIEYDEDGEEIFEGPAENGFAQPDAPQPQMRDNRDSGQNGQRDTYQRDNAPRENGQGQRENGQPRENRDRGNRDFNRENRGDRDGNRDYAPRDGQRDQNRDAQPREAQGRDPQQNRDYQNRDAQNRDPNANPNPNRDQNRGNREFNRENRGERNNRGFRENRVPRDGDDARGEAAVPSGLGPQPFVGLPPAASALVSEHHPQPMEAQPEFSNPSVPVEAQPELPLRTEGEPRRRGRPRRIRAEDGETVAPAAAEALSSETAASPVPAQAGATIEAPVADLGIPQPAAAGDAPEGEVKAKRRPGRPRKKKPDDEGGEDGGEHLPAFLMASNG